MNKFEIAIIGSGMSGLSCAKILNKHNIAYKIFEASSVIGGRIRSLKNFADFDIELGGEEIHGDNTKYYKIVKESGAKIFDYWTSNKFYAEYNGEFSTVEELSSKYKEVENIFELFEEASYKRHKDFEDISIKEYLINHNFSNEVYHLANAMFGIEAGTDINTLSIYGFSKICKEWEAGDDNFIICDKSHIDIITDYFSDEIKNVYLNTPIHKIDYNDDKVKLYDKNDNLYTFDIVVCTVPLSQIKNAKIKFTPQLTNDKLDAFSKIRLDTVAKIILKFSKPFWKDDLSWALIKGSINMFWPTGQGKDTKDYVLTGMTSGENCRELQKLYDYDKSLFINKVLSELQIGMKLNENISEYLLDYVWFNWEEQEFIGGGYTYPIIGDQNYRDIIRENIKEKIFFAGEGLPKNGHIGTIHGAMETGEEAAQEILKLIL